MIALAYASVDSAMTDPKPLEEDAKQSQAWKNLNRVCLMTLKWVIPEVYQGELENKDMTAKEFMEKIEKKFSKNKVVETRELFTKLSFIWIQWQRLRTSKRTYLPNEYSDNKTMTIGYGSNWKYANGIFHQIISTQIWSFQVDI